MADKGEAVRAGVCPICGHEPLDYTGENEMEGEEVGYDCSCSKCGAQLYESHSMEFSAFYVMGTGEQIATSEDEIGTDRRKIVDAKA